MVSNNEWKLEELAYLLTQLISCRKAKVHIISKQFSCVTKANNRIVMIFM